MQRHRIRTPRKLGFPLVGLFTCRVALASSYDDDGAVALVGTLEEPLETLGPEILRIELDLNNYKDYRLLLIVFVTLLIFDFPYLHVPIMIKYCVQRSYHLSSM